MIKVVNLKTYVSCDNEVLFIVDRTTPLGNPFHMKNESQRDQVCDEYKEYFYNKVRIKHPNFMLELNKILEIAKKSDVCLGCWCKQEDIEVRCHADTIKEYLDWLLSLE